MAIFKFFKRADVKNLSSLGSVIAYCVQKEKTKYENDFLVSGILCTQKTAIQDFKMTKNYLARRTVCNTTMQFNPLRLMPV